MKTGWRDWKSELSTIDTTFFIGGALSAAEYFNRASKEENEIRPLAAALYRRADWQRTLNGGTKISMGWKPESGFLKHRWEDCNEALDRVIIEVEDTGGGISPNVIGRIFDPVFTTKDKGSGLGLSVAHKIVAQHEGSLVAENTALGTVFRLTLKTIL